MTPTTEEHATVGDDAQLRDIVDDVLPLIDAGLSDAGVALQNRKLRATIEFIRDFVADVREDGRLFDRNRIADHADTQWFKAVYAEVDAWYRRRFGDALGRNKNSPVGGVTLAFGEPFALRIPMTSTKLETHGESAWLLFHDRVEDEDDPLNWLVDGPNLAALGPSELQDLRAVTTEIADALRFVFLRLQTCECPDDRIFEMRVEVVRHLERAAAEIARGGQDDCGRAQWDLQMACELAFKTLLQQTHGSFRPTHDLFLLWDDLGDATKPFARDCLKAFPRWSDIARFRYADAPILFIDQAFAHYRTALAIVREIVAKLRLGMDAGRLRILMSKPPWLSDPATLGLRPSRHIR